MPTPLGDWNAKAVDADTAVALVRSGTNVFLQGAAATPTPLIEALARRTDVEGVRLYHLHLQGTVPFVEPELAGRFRCVSLFTGANMRAAVNEGRADHVPIFLSEVPSLFASDAVPLDAAFVQLSPPDRHGFCSLGTSIDTARAAVDHARLVIAEINDRMPRTHGNTLVPFSRVDRFVRTDRPLYETPPEPETLSAL